MDERELFVRGIILDPTKRILEIGPLNRPTVTKVDFPNCFYCDIRNTGQVKALYTGNEYLETTGIHVDVNTIVDIDYVLKESYKETFRGLEKFDYIIASHVMEHVEDIIAFLNDIASVLKPKGKFCIVYPDKRYCFDHFREGASFRDAYDVYRRGTSETARMVLDFYNTAIDENDAIVYWSAENITSFLPKNNTAKAIINYEKVINGKKMDDVHFWPFSAVSFLIFLYDCVRADLLPYTCIEFHPTQENSQQFMVALEYKPEILENGYPELENIRHWISTAPEDYYNSHFIQIKQNNIDLSQKVSTFNTELSLCNKKIDSSNSELILKSEKIKILKRENELLTFQNEGASNLIQNLSKKNEVLERTTEKILEKNDILLSRIQSLETIQNSTLWHMTKPIRTILDFMKKI
ncbi:methyltransferase domain-containing protein [Flavobacterium sp. UBA6046]|uniref:methyltransferase domain-containing protein n=1 Tax=Flavobacterium sp. UBA6046 TaxID=1946552 RepID=UPI0025B816E6|nr:methyltransferase domain-containing protein [Flavobacterium sp. UBA6046]